MSIFEQLKAPFMPSQISWRIGSTTADKKKGMALAYIDARDVMDRLDEVCGPDGWQCTYPHANGKTVCAIGIRVCREGEGFEWIWKSDGAGDSEVEKEKGALSDAFKRSAVRWGVGRYLYHLDSPWVEITAAGRSFRIADHEMTRLERMLGAQPKAQSDPDLMVWDSKLATAANGGIELLRETWLTVPKDLKPKLKAAMDNRHKPAAEKVAA